MKRESNDLIAAVPRRHSMSQLPSSLAEETEVCQEGKRECKWECNIQSSMMADSVCSSLHDLHDISMNTSNTSRVGGIVQRTGEIQSHCSYWEGIITESARVPHVLVSHPSVEIRRTRSESQLNTSASESKLSDEVSHEYTIIVHFFCVLIIFMSQIYDYLVHMPISRCDVLLQMMEEIFEKRVENPIERSSTTSDMRMDEMERELRNFNERLIDGGDFEGRDESTLTPG